MEEAYTDGERALCRNLEDECKSREHSKCKGTGPRPGSVIEEQTEARGTMRVSQGRQEMRSERWPGHRPQKA